MQSDDLPVVQVQDKSDVSHVTETSDSRDIQNTENELEDNEKVEIEESVSTLENENVTFLLNCHVK